MTEVINYSNDCACWQVLFHHMAKQSGLHQSTDSDNIDET